MISRLAAVLPLLAFAVAASAQNAAAPKYDDYFTEKALRVDLFQVGDAKEQFLTLKDLAEEPFWSESPAQMVPSFGVGRYAISAYDPATNQLIFQRGYVTLFAEYRTTKPAIDGVKKVMSK